MRTVIAIALALWAAEASAQQYTIVGQGGVSCGTWQRESRYQREAFQAWVLGYVTRANYDGAATGANANLTAGTDANGLYAWIDNYCRAHPLEDLAAAAKALVAELQKRK